MSTRTIKEFGKRQGEIVAAQILSALNPTRIEVLPRTYFQRQIVEKGFVPQGVDPRHVEGYVRTAHSTINSLSWREIRREVRIAIACIHEGGAEAAERNALSFGL